MAILFVSSSYIIRLCSTYAFLYDHQFAFYSPQCYYCTPPQSNSSSALLFSISCCPAQHNVFRCGNKPQFLSPLSYLSHLHVPGLSDISDVERNLSELSFTSSVDSGFKGSGHSFRLRDRSPVRCKCVEWPCTSTARDATHSSRVILTFDPTAVDLYTTVFSAKTALPSCHTSCYSILSFFSLTFEHC